jgi:hypothetical protein
MKAIYLDCFNGISGDMLLGVLFDLGLDKDIWEREIGRLNLKGYRIEVSRVKKGALTGTNVDVIVEDNVTHRHAKDILEMIEKSELDEETKEKSLNILYKIASAEAKIHGESIEEVHLHELAGIDTIIDVVGSVLGLKLLGIEMIYSSALPLGEGFIETAHGRLPVPAPATIELLKGVPVYSNGMKGELVTPTGAGIISTITSRFGEIPFITVERIGYGAGKKEFPIPNMVRAIMGEPYYETQRETNTIIDVNIDDMNPQVYGYIMERLFNAGALDVFFTPIYMKKSRPAVKLTVISPKYAISRLIEIIFSETTSIGVRMYEVEKIMLPREMIDVDTPWGKAKAKISYLNGRPKVMPEYDDCKILAERTGLPIQEIMKEVTSRAIERIRPETDI